MKINWNYLPGYGLFKEEKHSTVGSILLASGILGLAGFVGARRFLRQKLPAATAIGGMAALVPLLALAVKQRSSRRGDTEWRKSIESRVEAVKASAESTINSLLLDPIVSFDIPARVSVEPDENLVLTEQPAAAPNFICEFNFLTAFHCGVVKELIETQESTYFSKEFKKELMQFASKLEATSADYRALFKQYPELCHAMHEWISNHQVPPQVMNAKELQLLKDLFAHRLECFVANVNLFNRYSGQSLPLKTLSFTIIDKTATDFFRDDLFQIEYTSSEGKVLQSRWSLSTLLKAPKNGISTNKYHFLNDIHIIKLLSPKKDKKVDLSVVEQKESKSSLATMGTMILK